MQRLFREARQVARARPAVVISGEPGTGKRALAEALHRTGGQGPLNIVHCSADTWRDEWRSAVAEGGTILLTRLSALDAAAQLDLADQLDVVAEGGVRPWIISLAGLHAAPPVPELRYRLEQVALSVPPLRDRGHDLHLLIEAWCDTQAVTHTTRPVVRPEAREALAAQDWPGNVRQLHNVLDAALLRAGSVIGVDALGLVPRASERSRNAAESLRDIERDAITAALARNGGNVTHAAKELGIGRATLHRRLRDYRLFGATAEHD
jgi:DNA-binding NtrC family response regulator